ncbi:unnamed protein product [Thelazia callipaeda]|uniref:Protein UBASH3A-like protein n=1 Tax=Thelazia callipaeda TaxID=103827 RepID=A0A0N5CKH6_THECL|nr:unnamed protein product [Thelazia callipaeda]
MEKVTRRLLVVRHGERCDFTFSQRGINWMKEAFDVDGKYRPFDLNLPRNLPKRRDGFEMFALDTPLTEMGYLQSKLTGRALRDHGIKVDVIYCSAALRCIQTAVGIIKGMENHSLKINVEPGLYEWTRWCPNGVPSWMTLEELTRLGYPINAYYIPLLKPSDLCINETLDEFYERSFKLVRKILKSSNEETILLVTHAPSLDALIRQLCGGTPRTLEDFMYNLQQIPYLACLQAVEQSNDGVTMDSASSATRSNEKVWKFVGSPIPALTHSSNSSFDTRYEFFGLEVKLK